MKLRIILPVAVALLTSTALILPNARAEDQVPQSQAQVTLSFAPIVKQATPAVVNVYTKRIVAQSQSPFAGDPFFSQFFRDQVVTPRVQNSLGSGVIVSPDGIVVSNYHVVGEAAEIRVVLSDKREFDAAVLLADPETDLAILKLDSDAPFPYLPFANSDQAEVGDLVLAIGNPFGVGQTVTSGIVSGLARSGGDMGRGRGYFVQTDAAINPGNSGGALVDISGQLLGINTSILSQSGGSNGIGFAIPANLVRQYVEQAAAGATELIHPWAGITVQPVDASLAEALGMDTPRGILVNDLHPDSPFAKAGIEPGDVITALGNLPVDIPQELDFRMSTLGVNTQTTVTWLRDHQENTAQVTLTPLPQGNVSEPVTLPAGTVFSGITVTDLTPALSARLGLSSDAQGVVVTEVGRGAMRTRLAPGDVILAINGRAISTTADMQSAVAGGGKSWRIDYLRNGRRIVMQLRGF